MRLLRISFFILAFLATGCSTFQEWREATTRGPLKNPEVFKISSMPQDPSKIVMLVQYSLEDVHHEWGPDYSKIFVAIPLDQDLNPAFPLNFQSSHKIRAGLHENLPDQQLRALRDYQFSPQAITTGSQLAKHASSSRPSHQKDNGSCINIANNIYSYNLQGERLDLSVIIWKEGDDTLASISSPSTRIFNAIDKPSPEGHSIILPVEISRPFSDRIKSIGMAVMKTPGDIALDIYVTAIVTPALYLVYGCCKAFYYVRY